MKKVNLKFFVMAFVAVLSMGFVSCSSDDADDVQSTVNVDVNFNGEGTRSIQACIQRAFSDVESRGYVATGKNVQVACDFSDPDKSINAVTTDAEGLNPADFVASRKLTYICDDVQFMIEENLATGYTAKWETGSLTGYEFKKGDDYLYVWAGAHVIATNNHINTNHSGGELF